MPLLPPKITEFLQKRSVRRNMAILLRFSLMLALLVSIYSVIFHYIMDWENRSYSWATGVYWSLTVMSTLGFGDITFTSDAGRIFSIFVLMSGILFFLTMMPFVFTQILYVPWLEAQKKGRTPRSVPAETKGHVIVVSTTPIALNLVDELTNYGANCVLLCQESQQTLDLLDRGYKAVVGEHDSGNVYRSLNLERASMLVALDSDTRNTNIVFTAREVNARVPIVASAQREDSIDILQLAGCSRVFQFHKLLGEALARRVLNDTARSSVISLFDELVVAEAPVMRTPLVGKSLRESGLRNATGANVIGLWERGKFLLPGPDAVFTNTMVMVIAGNRAQVAAVDRLLGPGGPKRSGNDAPVIIIGCGRVGLAAARQLQASKRDYRVIDKLPKPGVPKERMIVGDASDLDILEKADIRSAPSVLITTHDDDTNIYLTLYCRRLCKDIQIISRANLDRNVGMLHTAGADLVLSLASMVSSTIINLLSPGKVLMLNEGLNIFRSTVGTSLNGKQLQGSGIRSLTHCSVVALRATDGGMRINPEPSHIFATGEELFLIGDSLAEKTFYEKFGQEGKLAD